MPILVSPETKTAVIQPIIPSLWFGASTGAGGVLMGSVYATFKGHHAGLFSAVAGGQWFILGSTFWYSRSVLLRKFASKDRTSKDELLASAFAGSISGSIAGSLRSRHNILPAALVVGLVGLGGQAGISASLAGYDEPQDRPSIMQRLSKSRLWPLKSLSDEEYEEMLRNKILLIDAEMSALEGKISELRQLQSTAENAKT